MRDDPMQEPEYPEAVHRLASEGLWSNVFTGASFYSMPYGEPEVTHQIHVFRVS